MRKNILAAGITSLLVSLLFAVSDPADMFSDLGFGVPISILNIVLGLITKVPPGPNHQPENASVRLVVDRGVVKASIYQLVFLNSKVIFKRLSSVMITAVLALVLALVGFGFLFIIGGLMGGVTGFSLQEYLTQRARTKVGTGIQLTQTERNDIEINYSDLKEIRLVRSRLYLTSEDKTLVASLPRSYSASLEPLLGKIFGSKFVTEESVRSTKTTQK